MGASKIVHDITEHKQVELKLAHLLAIVESSDDAIISTTFDGVINSWNHGAARLFGYTADEVLGRQAGVLVPADQVNEEPPLLKMIQNGEHVDHYETIRQRKIGSLVNVSMTISPRLSEKRQIYEQQDCIEINPSFEVEQFTFRRVCHGIGCFVRGGVVNTFRLA